MSHTFPSPREASRLEQLGRAACAADSADTVAVLAYLVQQCQLFPMSGNHALALAEQHLTGRTLRTAFEERTEALARSADECIRLTNERDALRAALRRVLAASAQNSADAIAHARDVLQSISVAESGYTELQATGPTTPHAFGEPRGASLPGFVKP